MYCLYQWRMINSWWIKKMDKLPGLSVLSTAIELPFKWHYKGFPFVFSVCVNCCSSLWNLFTSLSGMKKSNLFLFPGTYIDVTDLNLARNYSSSQIHIVNEYLISQGSSKDVCVFFFGASWVGGFWMKMLIMAIFHQYHWIKPRTTNF